MALPKIGISVGDINGIGLEVMIRTLADQKVLSFCTPIIYGSTKVISYHKNLVPGTRFTFQSIGTPAEAQSGK
ncbi:MAG TPA: 4-hydroxythreonine-4-phosphate dehydrogenase PdxA, partial [Saprospiraceae bacterium]|nr:4-hydroxythreonine-4-phosphate dehydrogenase PdxA [Saprospiraceae bacterium]